MAALSTKGNFLIAFISSKLNLTLFQNNNLTLTRTLFATKTWQKSVPGDEELNDMSQLN